ncbi:MAG: HlyD family secretion protein [Candidatus Acidiferrales bacterium]
MASGAAPAQSATPPPAAHVETKPPEAGGRWPWLKYVTPLAILLIAALIVVTLTRDWNAYEGGKPEQATDDAYVRGDLTPLSTRVPGIVSRVLVSDYQKVHAGDLLVELEDQDYQAQVAQAVAAVAAAKAAIGNNIAQQKLQEAKIQKALAGIDLAKAQITAAQAGIRAVQADVTRTQAERKRQEGLIAVKSTTPQQLEVAVADQERYTAMEASRTADLEEAKSALQENEIAVEAERRGKDVLQSQALQLDADLQAKNAALSVAQINLGYTKIHAPADGVVGERQVRPGQLLSPGAQILTFVAETKWVQANYRETQLTRMKVGDAADITVDTLPGRVFRGKVSQIAPASGSQFALLPPDNATGNFTKVTQRIPVKITFDDPAAAAALQPGLSVVTTVHVK